MTALPLLLDASTLREHLSNPRLLLLDLSSAESYASGHLPGAVHLDPSRLLSGEGAVPNKLPSSKQLSSLFSELGLMPDSLVVAYDDLRGALAGRLLWTLDLLQHAHSSVLDGQRQAWVNAGLPLQTQANLPQPSVFQARINPALIADKNYLLQHLQDPNIVIWDARSSAEFRGEKVINASKGGHIPGAKNLEWTQCLISQTDWRLRDAQALREQLSGLGINPAQEVITHCQTHRRSGLTYLVAKALGYQRIRCYDGSWFEWGNDPDTPTETGSSS
ncbi:MAG: thiosulfate/3-mercaptopyruvate sulfurtransferase [Motiliproteus sp.]|jgi:thiosulfate/3-mercaptopyruvate sulfurtransferase